jgi:hypothetical protein
MIVGTAGHIDHGKTALIKVLPTTGGRRSTARNAASRVGSGGNFITSITITEENRPWWGVRTSNPGEAASLSRVGSTPALFRHFTGFSYGASL